MMQESSIVTTLRDWLFVVDSSDGVNSLKFSALICWYSKILPLLR